MALDKLAAQHRRGAIDAEQIAAGEWCHDLDGPPDCRSAI
jgi:hypothetical protein